MGQSVEQQIESIVRSLEEKGASAAPVVEATDLATSHPHAVSNLSIAVMQRFPKGGTFLDAALSYLPQEDWPQLVIHTLKRIEESSGDNEAADSVIAYASLQALEALHPHLSRIFELHPNSGSYYEMYPWRESGDQHFDYLRKVVEDAPSDEARNRAWEAMLQTRQPQVVEFAVAYADRMGFTGSSSSTDEWVQANLHLVGFHRKQQALHRTCHEDLYHTCFPDSFFEGESRPPWLARIHPSWTLSPEETRVRFGGMSDGRCSLCGGDLHRLVEFDPIPQGLGITGIGRLEIATCLSCLGWEQQPLFYRHEPSGPPVNVGYDGPSVTPEFPVGPLRACEAALAKTPKRWHWQDWALSNSRENLNRVGGEPCWVQDAEYPNCPSCDSLMPFLMQLDSDLPTEDGGEWLWGSGGIGYVFWCDACKVSGLLWQCT